MVKILLPSAVHLEERLTVSQSVSSSGKHSVRQSVRQEAGRQKHTVWVFSVADSATSSRESSTFQNKQWSNGNASGHRLVGRWFDSQPADRRRHRPAYQLCSIYPLFKPF